MIYVLLCAEFEKQNTTTICSLKIQPQIESTLDPSLTYCIELQHMLLSGCICWHRYANISSANSPLFDK